MAKQNTHAWEFRAVTDYDGVKTYYNETCSTQKELDILCNRFNYEHDTRIMVLTQTPNKNLLLSRLQDPWEVKNHLSEGVFDKRRKEFSKNGIKPEVRKHFGKLTITITQIY